jgi:outer membrane protein TolC
MSAEPLPWPDGIPISGVPELGDSSVELARLSPELLALDSRIEKAERLRSLARRGYFPDLTLGVDYIVTGEAVMPVDESGKDPLAVSASVSIPLWFGKHAAGVSEQTEQVISARDMRRHRENEIAARLEMVLFEIGDAARRVSLYEGEIVPSAEQSLASARSAYGSGAVGFETVVAAEQALLEFELALARAHVDAVVAASRFEQLLGGRLPPEPADGEFD